MKTIIIDETMCDQRVDRLIGKLFKSHSANSAQKWIRKKIIKVNGKKCSADTRLHLGDELQIYLPDELLCLEEEAHRNKVKRLKNRGMGKLNIVYEDSEILVVNKPKQLLVHPAEGEYKDALSTYVQSYLYEKISPTFRPASVSRLDFNTEGLVLFCKSYESLKKYNELMRERKIQKFYLAVCEGILKEDKKIEGYLEKEERRNKVKISTKQSENAKFISCMVHPLKNTRTNSLVEIELETGRSHQIRASLSSIGHPILGDLKYGAKQKRGIKSQVLCAHKLILPDRSIEIMPKLIDEVWNTLRKEGKRRE